MPYHTVKQGECLESIAHQYGFFWQTLWNDPNNAALKAKRKDPNVLLAGDSVFVLEKRAAEKAGATEERHRFRRKGVPSVFQLQLFRQDEPRAKEPYVLDIDGTLITGTTNSNGVLRCVIPPDAKVGKLQLTRSAEEFLLDLGHLDPVDELTGMQARLKNLGFYRGQVDGLLGPQTEQAIRAFQEKHGLSVTGKNDDATRRKLQDMHGV